MAGKKHGAGRAGRERGEDLLENVPPEVERRLLRFVNRAQIAEDLIRAPQEVRDTVGEHGREHGHKHLMPRLPRDPWREALLAKELGRKILRARPPFGYDRLRDLLAIAPEELVKWIIDKLDLLSAATFGEWSAPVPMEIGGAEVSVMHAALLHTGKVIFLPSSTNTLLWDPNNEAEPFTLMDGGTTGLTANLFCSGHSFLSDGKLLAVGGGGGGPGEASSIEAWKFDPGTETWQKTAGNMGFKRWYPTAVTLGDEPGRVLVASGWREFAGDMPPTMEIYSETTDSFTPVTAAGVVGEKLFPQTYPGLHILPGGEIFYAPVGFGDCSQDADPDPATEPSGYFVFSGTSGSWTNTGGLVRTKGMSVLLLRPSYPFVQVLVVGGGTATQSAQARLINLSTLAPSWGAPFSLLESRIHPNVVLLPDGTAFICGGMEETGVPGTGGRCEMYDPEAGTITEMAEVAYPRHYHSVALLLPSGQVLAAGGAQDGGCSLSVNNAIEVFSPPYLFQGARPTISVSPDFVHHGDEFEIETPEADDITRVVLVRPMAVTHQTDSEQRVIQLQFVQADASRLTATMPDGVHPHGMAPRGHYLLFILNSERIPSEGQFIYLH